MIKIILSGGGTGGHIYPAVAVAEALKHNLGDEVTLLFVGASEEMEMEKIPALGYDIVGLPVAGLQRRFYPKNVLLPFKVAQSLVLARRVIRDFDADVVVGFGGFASAPVLRLAGQMGIPTVLHESNSCAGLTNRMLAKRAKKICVAYDGMERFFPADRIVMTGNPLRRSFTATLPDRVEALKYFGFTSDRPVLLVVGGSLGSRTFNDMMKRHIERIVAENTVQVIWQTGKRYQREMDTFMAEKFGAVEPAGNLSPEAGNYKTLEKFANEHTEAYVNEQILSSNAVTTCLSRQTFIERMDLAYSAADLVISRSGAITVSELCLLGKAVMFIPSPNVAEDHQTRNAMALVDKGAAEICPDTEAVERAIPTALELVYDRERLDSLAANIGRLGIPDSADRVAAEVIRCIR